MRESEQLLVPLEEVFDPQRSENMKRHGVKGAIPIELSIEDLWSIAERKGYKVDGIDPDPRPDRLGMGFYWVYPPDDDREVELGIVENEAVLFYTKKGPNGKAVYILDDNFERFKELFLGQ